MSTLRIPVALAASVVALVSASTSFAQETTTPTNTTPEPPITTTTPPSNQTVVVQPPIQPQPQPQPQTQPAPVSTTTTTQGAYTYVPPASDRYTERTISRRPNGTLLSTGAGIFILSYGTSVVAGAVSDRDSDRNLFIPVAGPWIALGERDCAARGCGGNDDLAKAMLITSGAIQGAGVLLALSSLIIPETTKVEERTVVSKRPVEKKPSVSVLPISMGMGAGVGAVGRF